MYVKYDKYKVIFEESEGAQRVVDGFIALTEGENPEDYRESVFGFYKRVFYGDRITGIARFEPLTRKEIAEKRDAWGCGFKMFRFKPERAA